MRAARPRRAGEHLLSQHAGEQPTASTWRSLGPATTPPPRPSSSWLGTTYYLTRAAVRDTLDRIAALAAPGTRIGLDYKYPRHLVPADGLLFADKLDQFVAKRGEPMLSMFTLAELNVELRRAGFTEINHVSHEQQAQRYLEGRGDMTAPAPNLALTLFAA